MMFKHQFFPCLLLSLFCTIQSVAANDTALTITDDFSSTYLFEYSELLEDPSGSLSFEEVFSRRGSFLTYESGTLTPADLRHGLTRSAFWLKLNIINQSSEKQLFINSEGGLHKRVRAFIRSGDETGYTERQPEDKFRGTTFRLITAAGMRHSIYLKIQDIQTPLELTIRMTTTDFLLDDARIFSLLYASGIACLFILALYNLIYFVHLRDKGFLALAVFIAAYAIELGNFLGLWGYFSFARDYYHYLGMTVGLIALSALVSVYSQLLELKVTDPKGFQLLRVAFWGCLVLAASAPFIYYGTALIGASSFLLLICAFIIAQRLYLRKFKFPLSMLLSVTVFGLSMIPALLMGLGVIPIYGYFVDATVFSLLLSLLLLSLTQAEKVRMQAELAERTLASNQAKDEFLTTMSHELRTPMHAVVGAGRLLDMTKLSKEQSELVSRLNHSSDHMLSLVNDILDLARTEHQMLALEKAPFKLKAVLELLHKLLNGAAEAKGIHLSLTNHFTPFKQELLGDATRLKQVLLNLLNNAIKFTDQGQVSLTITPLQITSETARLQFEILDSGVGIPKEKLSELFQPFTQADSSTSRQYGGSGLGLAISQKLVQCMGGELNVDSEPNKGSRFFFTIDIPLQASTEKSHARTHGHEVQLTEDLKSYQVLLVDDDEMNRFFGKKLLEACGVSSVTAESGGQALEYLSQQHIDLVLLDISMPGMNGYETAKAIRDIPAISGVTIVALTAHAIKGERERCLASGMDGFLGKPFELSDLQDVLYKYALRTGQVETKKPL